MYASTCSRAKADNTVIQDVTKTSRKELVSLTIEKQQPRLLYRPQNKQFQQGVMLKNMNERMKELAEIAALTMSSAYNL